MIINRNGFVSRLIVFKIDLNQSGHKGKKLKKKKKSFCPYTQPTRIELVRVKPMSFLNSLLNHSDTAAIRKISSLITALFLSSFISKKKKFHLQLVMSPSTRSVQTTESWLFQICPLSSGIAFKEIKMSIGDCPLHIVR